MGLRWVVADDRYVLEAVAEMFNEVDDKAGRSARVQVTDRVEHAWSIPRGRTRQLNLVRAKRRREVRRIALPRLGRGSLPPPECRKVDAGLTKGNSGDAPEQERHLLEAPQHDVQPLVLQKKRVELPFQERIDRVGVNHLITA